MAMDGTRDKIVFDPWDLPIYGETGSSPHADTRKTIAASLVITALGTSLDQACTKRQLSSLGTTPSITKKLPPPADTLGEALSTNSISLIKNFLTYYLAFNVLPKVEESLQTDLGLSPATAKTIAGAIMGFTQAITNSPITTIWTKHCADRSRPIRSIPLDKSLFAGTTATIARNALYWIIYPLMNDFLKSTSSAPTLITGAIAGTSATLITYPLDTLSKLKRNSEKSLIEIIRTLSKKPQKAYQGAAFCFARMALTSAIISILDQPAPLTREQLK